MTHRLDLHKSTELTTVFFQGLLDRSAFAELETLCQAEQRRGSAVRVRLGAGTKVEADLLEELVRIDGVAVEAESPFLARWIASCLNAKPTVR